MVVGERLLAMSLYTLRAKHFYFNRIVRLWNLAHVSYPLSLYLTQSRPLKQKLLGSCSITSSTLTNCAPHIISSARITSVIKPLLIIASISHVATVHPASPEGGDVWQQHTSFLTTQSIISIVILCLAAKFNST